MAVNCKQLGEPQKVKKTWLWTIIGFAAFVVLASVVPAKVPGIVFSVVNTAVITVLVQKFQGAQIKAHIEAGGALYKTGRAVLIALACAAVFIALILALYFLTDLHSILD